MFKTSLIAYQARIYNMGIIAKRIKFALAPFEPGTITLTINDDYRFNDVLEVRIEVGLLPNLPFLGYPQLCSTEDEMVWILADEAFLFYRNRPALPVDDHIVLGEN